MRLMIWTKNFQMDLTKTSITQFGKSHENSVVNPI